MVAAEPQTFDWQAGSSGDTSWRGKARSWIVDKPGRARSLVANRTLAVHQEIAHTLRGEGYDASEDGTGRGTPLVARYRCSDCGEEFADEHATGVGGLAPAECPKCGEEQHVVAHTITGREGKGPDSDFTSGAVLAYSATDYKDGAYEEVEQAGPLTTSADRTRSAPIAFSVNQRREGRLREVRGSLNGEASGTQVDGVLAWGISSDAVDRSGEGDGSAGARAGLGIVPEAAPALRSRQNNAVAQAAAIPRRLTPRECERLQAFPDEWTAWGLTEDGERVELSDSARYRQLGNAVTATVSEWIGRRILAAALAAGEPADLPIRASAGDAGAEREASHPVAATALASHEEREGETQGEGA